MPDTFRFEETATGAQCTTLPMVATNFAWVRVLLLTGLKAREGRAETSTEVMPWL